MMKFLYLLSVVFHVTAGCALSGGGLIEMKQSPGDSVLLPCSCSDPSTRPQKFTWTTYRAGHWTDVLNDEQYRGRFQMFNKFSPANLSLLISDLREKDQGDYRCSTETQKYRDFRISIKVQNVLMKSDCVLSGDNNLVVYGHKGGSVLLPCSCSDLHTKPRTFTWTEFSKIFPNKVFGNKNYRGRFQLFNQISPSNLSLLISDLREEDQVDYRCSTEKEFRDIKIQFKGGNETSTRSKKPDAKPPTKQPPSTTKKSTQTTLTTRTTTKPQPASSSTTHVQNVLMKSERPTSKPTTTPSKQPQSKPTNSPAASSSTTPEQNDVSFPSVFVSVSVVLLAILGGVALICWRRRGGRCGKSVITEGRPGYKGRQNDQAVPDVTYSTVSHVNTTAGATQAPIGAEDQNEYASIITN